MYKIDNKAPRQGGPHDEVNEWPNCDEKKTPYFLVDGELLAL